MYYTPFLLLKSQLSDQKRAKLFIEGVEVFFHASEDSVWEIRAKIHMEVEGFSTVIKERISAFDFVKLHSRNVQVKVHLEEGYIEVIQKVLPISTFLQFKDCVESFMTSYDLWSGVMKEIPTEQYSEHSFSL